ncbi:AMP-dependent synthetase/ligase [Streptomyces sp. CA-250714]|uniref:AMP-dependent synthetase/ligase n=1 Tax=Streptomyces sp. CA-250714 TaxID=3240060 RepID=UPI003D93FD3F
MSDIRPETLALFTEWTAERYGQLPALRFRRHGDGAWTDIGYDQLRDRARRIGRGLLGLGVRPGERVAVLAETCPEWTYAHFGLLAAGAVLVPVYPTAGEEEIAWVLADSGACAVLCGDETQAARVEALRDRLPRLRHVRLLDAPYERPAPLDALLERARAVPPEATAGIVYTSGTTGPPKGCVLRHANFNAVRDATVEHLGLGPGDRTYLYLPLAHLLAQLTELATLLEGATLAYFGGRIEDVVGELAEVAPTHLPSVPRLFEKVHATVAALAQGQGADGPERLAAAVRTGLEVADLEAAGRPVPEELAARHAQAEKRLFSLVRAAFGGRLRRPVSGGAPLAPQTRDFLRACGLPVYEGYGMTESAGLIALSRPGAHRPGTVGKPLAGCEVRIAEDGEVLARGPMVFPGYHANEAATAEILDAEGRLHTGDLGALDEDGYLSITGRKKDLIITSAGKNITPSLLEFALQQSRWISQAVLIGDNRPYPVALITCDREEIARLGLTGPPSRDVTLRRLVQEAVDAANAQAARPARIRAFAILDEDFDVGTGELTPTLKVRRGVVARRHAARIEALYARKAPQP